MEAPLLRGGRSFENGIATIEALFVAMIMAIVVLGATVAFSGQRRATLEVTLPENLRDAVSAVDVDVNALGAYDPSVQAKVDAAGQRLWTASIPGGSALATMQVSPVAGGVSVSAEASAEAASVIAPIASPQPTPS